MQYKQTSFRVDLCSCPPSMQPSIHASIIHPRTCVYTPISRLHTSLISSSRACRGVRRQQEGRMHIGRQQAAARGSASFGEARCALQPRPASTHACPSGHPPPPPAPWHPPPHTPTWYPSASITRQHDRRRSSSSGEGDSSPSSSNSRRVLICGREACDYLSFRLLNV